MFTIPSPHFSPLKSHFFLVHFTSVHFRINFIFKLSFHHHHYCCIGEVRRPTVAHVCETETPVRVLGEGNESRHFGKPPSFAARQHHMPLSSSRVGHRSFAFSRSVSTFGAEVSGLEARRHDPSSTQVTFLFFGGPVLF